MSARVTELLTRLRSMRNEVNIAGQQRFGIRPTTEQLGISMTSLRAIGKALKSDHALALELWTSEVHEARLLAAIIDDHKQVTKEQIALWAQGSYTQDCENFSNF
jgi:3-methyladenine DNA glycosylase AlkD